MKRYFFRSRYFRSSGFTLVELLVVIGIIAILASVLFPVVTSSINAAKRARAGVMAGQIQTSVIAYFTEYSIYPVPTANTTDTLIGDNTSGDGASWATLDCVLCGNIHPSTGLAYTPPTAGPTNTRAITFMTLKVSDVFSSGSTTGVQDAPKNPLPSSTTANIYFNIAMDSDYDGVLGVSPSTITSLPILTGTITAAATGAPFGGTSTAGVAVWANCNANTKLTTQNASFWVKTY